MVAIVDAERSALLIIDMQNDFCHDDGAMAKMGHDTRQAQEIAPRIDRLAGVARRAGVPVIFASTSHGPWSDTTAWASRGLVNKEAGGVRTSLAASGSWGAQLYQLESAEGDLLIEKHRYSAFAYTPLELALDAKGRDTLLLTGTRTHVCVAYTASDAIARGYKPVVVADCTADGSADRHASALRDFEGHLGELVWQDDAESQLTAVS